MTPFEGFHPFAFAIFVARRFRFFAALVAGFGLYASTLSAMASRALGGRAVTGRCIQAAVAATLPLGQRSGHRAGRQSGGLLAPTCQGSCRS